jgi:hypothetical protein
MKPPFPGTVGRLRSRESPVRRARSLFRSPIAFLLLLILVGRETAAPARVVADATEDRMLTIAKTTVYGALLGGVLGLASALVVKEEYRDDAIRWGVAGGTFGGFLYGVLSSGKSDDFSLGPEEPGAGREGARGWAPSGPAPLALGRSPGFRVGAPVLGSSVAVRPALGSALPGEGDDAGRDRKITRFVRQWEG